MLPGRWQTSHFSWSMGATSFVNVTGRPPAVCADAGGGTADVPITRATPVIRRHTVSVLMSLSLNRRPVFLQYAAAAPPRHESYQRCSPGATGNASRSAALRTPLDGHLDVTVRPAAPRGGSRIDRQEVQHVLAGLAEGHGCARFSLLDRRILVAEGHGTGAAVDLPAQRQPLRIPAGYASAATRPPGRRRQTVVGDPGVEREGTRHRGRAAGDDPVWSLRRGTRRIELQHWRGVAGIGAALFPLGANPLQEIPA